MDVAELAPAQNEVLPKIKTCRVCNEIGPVCIGCRREIKEGEKISCEGRRHRHHFCGSK